MCYGFYHSLVLLRSVLNNSCCLTVFAAAVKFSEHDLKYKTDSKYNKDAADVTLCLQLQWRCKNKNPLTSRRFLRDWASSLWTCFLPCCFHTDRRWPRRHMTRAVGSGRSCPGSKRSRLWWRCSRDRPAWTRTASRCRYLWATTEEEQPRDRRETTTGRCTVASYYTGSNPTVFSTKNVAATYRAEVCTSMLPVCQKWENSKITIISGLFLVVGLVLWLQLWKKCHTICGHKWAPSTLLITEHWVITSEKLTIKTSF